MDRPARTPALVCCSCYRPLVLRVTMYGDMLRIVPPRSTQRPRRARRGSGWLKTGLRRLVNDLLQCSLRSPRAYSWSVVQLGAPATLERKLRGAACVRFNKASYGERARTAPLRMTASFETKRIRRALRAERCASVQTNPQMPTCQVEEVSGYKTFAEPKPACSSPSVVVP